MSPLPDSRGAGSGSSNPPRPPHSPHVQCKPRKHKVKRRPRSPNANRKPRPHSTEGSHSSADASHVSINAVNLDQTKEAEDLFNL